MDDKQLQAAVDYINDNTAALHGLDRDNARKLDVGEKITVDNVISSRLTGSEVIVIVDRGIKGTPKYRIPAEKIEAAAQSKAALATAAVKAKEPASKVEADKKPVKKQATHA